jgi:hypothetical protein
VDLHLNLQTNQTKFILALWIFTQIYNQTNKVYTGIVDLHPNLQTNQTKFILALWIFTRIYNQTKQSLYWRCGPSPESTNKPNKVYTGVVDLHPNLQTNQTKFILALWIFTRIYNQTKQSLYWRCGPSPESTNKPNKVYTGVVDLHPNLQPNQTKFILALWIFTRIYNQTKQSLYWRCGPSPESTTKPNKVYTGIVDLHPNLQTNQTKLYWHCGSSTESTNKPNKVYTGVVDLHLNLQTNQTKFILALWIFT